MSKKTTYGTQYSLKVFFSYIISGVDARHPPCKALEANNCSTPYLLILKNMLDQNVIGLQIRSLSKHNWECSFVLYGRNSSETVFDCLVRLCLR